MVFGIMGKTIQDAFRVVADAKGGELTTGLLGSNAKVQLRFHDWTIEVDDYAVSNGNSSQQYTRVAAAFPNQTDIDFKISPAPRFLKGLFHVFQTPVVVEIPSQYGRDQEVRGTPPKVIKAMFADPKLQEAVEGYERNRITIDHGAKLFGSSRKKRYGIDTLKFEFSYLEKNGDTLVQVVEVVEALLLAIHRQQMGPKAKALAPGERPMLNALIAALDPKLAWLSARFEPSPSGTSARLSAPLSGVDAAATLQITAPSYPFLQSTVILDAELKGGVDATLQTPGSLLDKMANLTDMKLGDSAVDDAFVIRSPSAGAKPALEALVRSLNPIAQTDAENIQLQFTPDRLQVKLDDVDQEDVIAAVNNAVGLWKAALEQGLGVGSL